MVWRGGDDKGGRVIPRAEGCVLLLYDRQWEDEVGLLPVSDPIPVEDWLSETRQAGYRVEWTPEGALAAGSYRGGIVVEVTDGRGRSYVAVPPEALGCLEGIMDRQAYEMVREDLIALANPEDHQLAVTRLDRAAWEERRQIVPVGEPLGTEGWARVIRERGLHVTMVQNSLLPLESQWPAGQVVLVSAADGTQRSYFAVPRTALGLAITLAREVVAESPGTADGS